MGPATAKISIGIQMPDMAASVPKNKIKSRSMPKQSITPKQRRAMLGAIHQAPSYRRAYQDIDFLSRDELRPVRLQLELLKPEMLLTEHHIHSTVVVFGSARIYTKEDGDERL